MKTIFQYQLEVKHDTCRTSLEYFFTSFEKALKFALEDVEIHANETEEHLEKVKKALKDYSSFKGERIYTSACFFDHKNRLCWSRISEEEVL